MPYSMHDEVQDRKTGLIAQMQVIDHKNYRMLLSDGLQHLEERFSQFQSCDLALTLLNRRDRGESPPNLSYAS
jgi:hypothetical protein